jgi:hypothetical protein
MQHNWMEPILVAIRYRLRPCWCTNSDVRAIHCSSHTPDAKPGHNERYNMISVEMKWAINLAKFRASQALASCKVGQRISCLKAQHIASETRRTWMKLSFELKAWRKTNSYSCHWLAHVVNVANMFIAACNPHVRKKDKQLLIGAFWAQSRPTNVRHWWTD